MKLSKPEIIEKSINNNWLNVFLVPNPILAIITRIIIDNYNLKKENILIVSLRDTSLEIFDHNYLIIQKKKYDKYLEKIFFDSPSGRRVLRKINKTHKNFILFSGWAYREVNWLITKHNCKGHIHVEEGQSAYASYTEYKFDKLDLFERIRMNISNRIVPTAHIPHLEGTGLAFRDDAEAYIGIDERSFSLMPSSKRYILRDFKEVKKYYEPKILGKKIIGLTCSASRVPKKENMIKMLKKLIDHLPTNSLIKPHPSYTSSNEVFKEFTDIFNDLNSKKIELCDSTVMLEIEMMYEKKIIIGPQSSLSVYTESLGSEYKFIQLY